MGRDRFFVCLLLSGLLGLVPACRTAPKRVPLDRDAVVTEVRQHPGSALAGPRADFAVFRPDEFRFVSVQYYPLERFPKDLLRPVTDHADLVVESGEGSLFLPAPRLLQGTRLEIGEQAVEALNAFLKSDASGEFLDLVPLPGVIATGTTARMRILNRQPRVLPHLTEPVREGVSVEVGQTVDGNSYLVALGLLRVLEPEPPLPTAGLGPEERGTSLSEREAATFEAVRREAVILTLPIPEEPVRIAALVPADFLATGGEALAIVITVTGAPPEDTEDGASHARKVADFEAERVRINEAREHETIGTPVERQIWTGLKSALAGLRNPEARRSALAYLGRTTEAWLAEDVALSASREALDLIVDRALEKIGTPDEKPDAAELGLELEQSAYEIAHEFLRSQEAPPGLEGIILRHTGEVGRHPAMLSEFVEKAASLADLRERLVAENIVFLEDSSPVSRVRAYDWLSENRRAPEGFDPLASRKERRAAMNRFLESLESDREGDR
jgi:hypothetical protein